MEKQKMRWSALSLALGLITITSCEKKNSVGPEGSEDPIEIGCGFFNQNPNAVLKYIAKMSITDFSNIFSCAIFKAYPNIGYLEIGSNVTTDNTNLANLENCLY